MQYDFIFAYLRLSRDDKEKMEESNSIKNQTPKKLCSLSGVTSLLIIS